MGYSIVGRCRAVGTRCTARVYERAHVGVELAVVHVADSATDFR